MKKVLILGVNGFIGHHLSQSIIASTDWQVYGMDLNSERVADLLGHERFHFFEGDITISKEWDRVSRAQMRRDSAAGGDRHAGDLCQGAAAGF
jgi:nucleoside-diphosphate-sugar epimerase